MKKLNRKGFTLVELLAVIVILAIVVGITLVTILPTLSETRQKAFDASAETAADFLEKQYQLSLVGDITGTDQTLTSIPKATYDADGNFQNAPAMTADDLRLAGLDPANYDITGCTWYIENGRACVTLKAADTGDYVNITNKTTKSAGCSS